MAYLNEVKAVRGGFVHKVLCSGGVMIYTAWERDDNAFFGQHGTITHLDCNGESIFCGRVGTKRYTCDLPVWTPERSRYCRAKQGRMDARAYAMITEAYPDARSGRKWMGEISIQVEQD